MIGVAVTLHRYVPDGGLDAHGHQLGHYTSEIITGCAWKPGQEAESTQGSEQVTANAQVYIPPGWNVGPFDRIEYPPGTVYEVSGSPSDWTSPFTGNKSPTMIDLRDVTGGSAHTTVSGTTGTPAKGGP